MKIKKYKFFDSISMVFTIFFKSYKSEKLKVILR